MKKMRILVIEKSSGSSLSSFYLSERSASILQTNENEVNELEMSTYKITLSRRAKWHLYGIYFPQQSVTSLLIFWERMAVRERHPYVMGICNSRVELEYTCDDVTTTARQ